MGESDRTVGMYLTLVEAQACKRILVWFETYWAENTLGREPDFWPLLEKVENLENEHLGRDSL